MLKKVIALTVIFSSFNAFAIECKAIDRALDSDNKIIESEAKLDKTFEAGSLVKLEGELKGQLYFLTYDAEDGDGLLQIVNANDYTKGIVSRSAFNKAGRMSLSQVDGQNVQRLECTL